MKAPILHRMDKVALLREVPEHGLHYGEVGVVVQSHPGGLYDVEFMLPDETSVLIKKYPSDDLVLVRHQEAYF